MLPAIRFYSFGRKWERQISLDYLMDEKFVQFAGPEPDEEYPFTVCGQTVLLCNAALAAALSAQPKQTQEVILRYYFLRQPQRVIGVQHETKWVSERSVWMLRSDALLRYSFFTAATTITGIPASLSATLHPF